MFQRATHAIRWHMLGGKAAELLAAGHWQYIIGTACTCSALSSAMRDETIRPSGKFVQGLLTQGMVYSPILPDHRQRQQQGMVLKPTIEVRRP